MIPIRLQGPQSSNGTGRVEVFYRGEWGTICDNYWWDLRAANVACRQLGYQYAVRTIPGYVPSSQSSRKIRLNAIRCTGKEQNLTTLIQHGDTVLAITTEMLESSVLQQVT